MMHLRLIWVSYRMFYLKVTQHIFFEGLTNNNSYFLLEVICLERYAFFTLIVLFVRYIILYNLKRTI